VIVPSISDTTARGAPATTADGVVTVATPDAAESSADPVATTRYEYVVPAAAVASVYVVTPASTDASTPHVPPAVDRSIRYPPTPALVLPVHASDTAPADVTAAVTPVGADGTSTVVPVLPLDDPFALPLFPPPGGASVP
jgi:hypothetical protein